MDEAERRLIDWIRDADAEHWLLLQRLGLERRMSHDELASPDSGLSTLGIAYGIPHPAFLLMAMVPPT